MKIYITVGVYQGVANEVKATIDPIEAHYHLENMEKEYALREGEEQEAENDVKQFEVEL